MKKALEALVREDFDTFFNYCYGLSDTEKELGRSNALKDTNPIVKFKIQDERIFDNGEKAEITVKYFKKNGDVKTEKASLLKTKSGWKIVSE